MYTSQSPKHLAAAARSKKQTKWAARGSTRETLDETLCGSHPVTNVFGVWYSAPLEWQPDKVREKKQTDQVELASKERKMKWQKRENIHKVVLKLFIEAILVQFISDVLENP